MVFPRLRIVENRPENINLIEKQKICINKKYAVFVKKVFFRQYSIFFLLKTDKKRSYYDPTEKSVNHRERMMV